MEPHEKLYKFITATHPIGADAWEEMRHCWHPYDAGRKQVLTRQGDVEHYVYFVLEGVQRAYIAHRDKESTLVFSYENSFSGIIDSFFVQKPSKYCLETLTRSRFLRIHYNDFMRLLEKHRSLESWTRIALMATLAGTLERNIELLSFTAEERFTTLLRRSPQVLNMIPHKYLASYIGVDPATFSKLLASVRL
ncbi:MAG: Crp/Fnr family transcriptional regulator [Taibaiella sp.]|nr:Crp/Fnr family transcriptional regulator [Taibaiella sp.]